MNTSKRNLVVVGVIALIIAGLAGVLYWKYESVPSKNSIAGKPELVATYEEAINEESLIGTDPSNPLHYAAAGLAWKGLGDVTSDARWYRQALRTYEAGIKNTRQSNTLLITNAAVIDVLLGKYTEAESYYRKAIELSPGDTQYYISLATLMRTKLNSPTADILAVYTQALDRVISTGDIFMSRAFYYKTIGQYDSAIADFDMLFKAGVLSKADYDQEIQEMSQLKAESKK